jgi:subtilisin-like proprotein convertase family protein
LYTNATTTNAYVAGTQTPSVYAAPTQFTAYTVTGTDGTTGCSNTAVALVNYTPPAPTVTPNPVAMCLGDAAVRLTSSSATSTTLSFNSGTIAVNVPDNNPVGTSNNLTVSGVPANGNVSGLKVTWNMTHTWDGDMVFVLKSPTGAILNLDYFLSNTGGAGVTTGFVNTAVGSTGVTALSAGSGTYTGLFKADALLTGAFGPTGPTGYLPTTTSWAPLYGAGVAANGTYTLAMYDGGAGDVGVLTSWNLDVTYVVGVPSTAATWSPVGGLFTDPAATLAYTGTPRDTVYTRPTPAGVYNYNVTVNSLPLAPAVPATPMAGGNGNNMVLFNVANNNGIDYTLTSISTNAFASGVATAVNLYRKTSPIAGNPGAINAGNGWVLVGTASNVSVTANTLNNVLSGLNVLIPAGATHGIALEFTGAATFPAYTNGSGVVQTYTSNGCSIITDGNIGWGGPVAPGPPANNPRNFNGTVSMVASVAACTSPARTVVVTVNTPITITAQPVNAVVCTDKTTTFTVAAAGTTPSYQWQVSTDGGTTFTNVSNGGAYSGATTATLTITAPPVSYNGYIYRCMVSGAAPCPPVPSANRLLTVNPLPTIVISASPYQNLLPTLSTTLFSTSSPAAATYTWLRNGFAVSGATASSLLIRVDGQGSYRLRVVDVNGCVNLSNTLVIADSTSGRVFISPNPTSGQFVVRYNPAHNIVTPNGVNIFDARGKRVLTQKFTLGIPFAPMAIDLSNQATGVYWVEVVDLDGNRLAVGRVEVIR